jgi:hypothetical protein
MTEQPPDEELEPDEVPDESSDTLASHPVPTAEEMVQGQQLGETIDPDDDEDAGVPE